MREYKFRAWEKSLKEMIPVHNIDFESKIINTNDAWRMFHEVELMQYTGLKDSKRTKEFPEGQEIYEGDIVRCYGGEYCQGYWEHDVTIIIKNMINDCFMMGESEHLVIKGNIYENPELLL